MNNKIILGIIGVIVVVGIALVAFKGGDDPQVANNSGVYCSTDGTLSGTMPIQSHRSYCIKSDVSETTYTSNTPSTYSFSIVDDQGNTLKELDIVHEKIMHFIVVRKDLANFQHVHPEFNSATGEFTLSDLVLPSDGEYRLFTDFTPSASMMDPNGEKLPVTISQDVRVGNIANYKPQSIGDTTNAKIFDGYQLTLITNPVNPTTGSENKITFDIKQDGKPVTDLEQYLGALGHSVILSEGDLQFIHGHPVEDSSKPQTGKVNFMVSFPEAGKYKVFTQFQRQGKITTTDFVVDVVQGQESGSRVKHGGDSMTH